MFSFQIYLDGASCFVIQTATGRLTEAIFLLAFARELVTIVTWNPSFGCRSRLRFLPKAACVNLLTPIQDGLSRGCDRLLSFSLYIPCNW
ncbi:uncharacterized protein C8R40DRAFT_779092 [Lentinula edodes]|uniref:uncharacterized protein n=1 Tax=Lentinula edodes TaxID=5353 RepID=UPI001E8CE063|nr:uncharacterized protein C8R40DRAFT_779092 [Lentinula edodes]KAH7878651.1 hypothetical protein C8R40DRAFT_779092 [Lentinula edodes]